MGKGEPSPEGELLRGVHDHQTVYTLTVSNNLVHPTTETTLDDYLPAGLEFLGCGGGPDNTTNAPTNPGSASEYPGSGPIVVAPLAGCTTPLSVATEDVDPDGPTGPLASGVYTHVVWAVGALAPGQVETFPYRAAVPLRANTNTFSGARPSPSSLGQAVNLDNNSGPEVTDETTLTNLARVQGTDQSTTPIAASDSTTLSRTAEDLLVHKTGSSPSLGQQAITTWTLTFLTGEYKFVDGATVTDTLPSGLCPLGAVNLTTQNDPSDAECDPTGDLPSSPYLTAVEHADGTWTITWDASTFAQLAHTGVNDRFTLTFPTRTRAAFQSGFLPTTPILTGDAVANSVTTQGAGFARCTAPGTPDCSTSGPRIDHDGIDGSTIGDASSSDQIAAEPGIAKRVAASGTDCLTASYVSTVPHYHPGDRVCWLVRVDFPAVVDTVPLTFSDFLPADATYETGSDAPLAPNDVAATIDDSGAAEGLLRWSVAGGEVPAGQRRLPARLLDDRHPDRHDRGRPGRGQPVPVRIEEHRGPLDAAARRGELRPRHAGDRPQQGRAARSCARARPSTARTGRTRITARCRPATSSPIAST